MQPRERRRNTNQRTVRSADLANAVHRRGCLQSSPTPGAVVIVRNGRRMLPAASGLPFLGSSLTSIAAKLRVLFASGWTARSMGSI
jgi:hypothetical protein